jgi:hypothetical protein
MVNDQVMLLMLMMLLLLLLMMMMMFDHDFSAWMSLRHVIEMASNVM